MGQRSNSSDIIRRQYYFGPEDMVISGDHLMCRWVMQTDNARECGAFSELYNKGMLKATGYIQLEKQIIINGTNIRCDEFYASTA